jgi:hypothetical protein
LRFCLGTFTVFCLAPGDDPEIVQSKLLYEKLIEKTGMEGKVKNLSLKIIFFFFSKEELHFNKPKRIF